jgi:hypothetical protein
MYIKMQDEVNMKRQMMAPSKGWRTSDVWEEHKQINFYSGEN